MKKTYKAGRLEAIGKIAVGERTVELKDDDILVKTFQASICLADVQTFQKGYYVEAEPLTFPVYLGHEAGGIIEYIGPKVVNFKTGDKVILMHDVRRGGIGPGGMAEYFIGKPSDLVPVPDGMDMELASLGETIAPFIFVVQKSGVKIGDFAVVTGLNFIGQIMAQGLKKSGAFKVVGIDTNDFRCNLAEELGIDMTINSKKEDAEKIIKDLTHGKGADIVCQSAAYIDPTVEEYMNLATEIVRPMGILAFQGDFLNPVTIKNMHRWHHQSLDIRSIAFRHYSQCQVLNWAEDALKPVVQGMIKIKPLLTATYPLDQIDKAFDEAIKNPNTLKVILKP